MKEVKARNSIELFSGAGGLALGLENAGFHHDLLIEWGAQACDTLKLNNTKERNWNVLQMDVRNFDYRAFEGKIDLIAGGPPCQPFSLGGKHRGFLDERDMFPEAVRSIREVRPQAFVFENVKGLTRPAFAKYFEYIYLQLSHPEVVLGKDEKWLDHLARLENHHTKGSRQGLGYNVVFRVLNAADYGVPQSRFRVVLVGFRSDLGIEWSFPEPTHSYESLLYSQAVSGEYWEKHGVAKKRRIVPSHRDSAAKFAFEDATEASSRLPWRTVRDALAGLPDPDSKAATKVLNHTYAKGGRQYPGHTGSHLDLPSKTIKAGDHGVPGGENMLLYPSGEVRYFSVREAARIQTFPDDYFISGSWTESMRQLGNAVPVQFGQVIGDAVMEKLSSHG